MSQRRADALEHILGRFLAGKCSGSAAGAHEVVVHIAHDALCDVPESSGAEFDNGRNVAVETARRLGCDGALVGVVDGVNGEPLAVGRRTRAVPPAIRRARCASATAAAAFRAATVPAMYARPSHPALGRWGRDQPGQPGYLVFIPSPAGA